ncbi:glycosyl hydrolase family 28-related protein [Pseudomonas aeruginosa]|uniref:glycosyl hydrolase family 28-related protein n=1 Tax=Pseudomonas aeruginosa TaxID=287 RepID=UPI0008FB6F31|nr:glycosyl hydrolase family 28-related protein [Pseudomonas aeruginosa]
MRYNTGNPVGQDGSSSPFDFHDNAGIADQLVTGTERKYPNRLGVPTRSFSGMNLDFDESQAAREIEFSQDQSERDAQYQQKLTAMGWSVIGDYAAGLTISTGDQVFKYAGEYYKPKATTALPYTTTGVWADESNRFASVGDGVLRQDLSSVVPGFLGATLIGGGIHVLINLEQMRSSSKNTPSKVAQTLGYYSPGDGGGGTYYLDESDLTSGDNGGSVIVAADGGRWKLADNKICVKQFGAKGDGVTDDTVAIQAAYAHAATLVVGRKVHVPASTYRTSASIVVPDGCSSEWVPGVVLQRHGSAPKNFAAIQLNGNGRRHELGIIDNYKDGILVRGSTNTVVFQTVSNCTRGVIISAVDRSSIDNKISGTQIGLCTEAIVFEQNGIRTQQGNEVRVNFVSETLHTLVFDDLGTHTETSDWDSNYVELIACDPFYKVGATLVYNKSAFGVPNLHYIIKSWAGGWNYNDGTITVIQGGFAACQFEFSFAAQLSPQSMLGPALRTGYGGCQVKLLRNQNLGTNTAYAAVTSASIDTFNGGIALNTKRFRISCTVPALATGQSAVRVFSHVLCQSSHGGKFKIASVEANSHPYILNIRELGTTTVGMVGIGFQNPSAATIPETTLNLIIEAGD